MSKPKFEGYDIIAESGDFLLVDTPSHALYPRRWSSYQVLAQLTVVCGEWHVGFVTWSTYPIAGIQSVAAFLDVLTEIPVSMGGHTLTLTEITETNTNE